NDLSALSLYGLRELFDPDPRYTVAIHLQYSETASLVFQRRAHLRNLSEAEEQESRERFEACIGRQFDAVIGFQIADARGAVELDTVDLRLARLDLLVMLVFDAAHELFEDVLDGDQSGDGAEFIDDQRHMRVTLAKLFEQLGNRFGFRHDHRM